MTTQKRLPVQCQWYQTAVSVTASLKLPLASRKDITVNFERQYCAIYDGGEMCWECYLANPVHPEKCKLVAGKVRSEVRFSKVENINWVEFEVGLPCKKLAIHSKTKQEVQNEDAMVSERKHHNSSPPITNNYTPEDLMLVDHLSHDFMDQGSIMKVIVQVAEVLESGCKVTFTESSMEMKFQTKNKRFLKMYEDCTPSTYFSWRIDLFGRIVVPESRFKVLPKCLEVYLQKMSPKRWKTLTPSRKLEIASHQQTSDSALNSPTNTAKNNFALNSGTAKVPTKVVKSTGDSTFTPAECVMPSSAVKSTGDSMFMPAECATPSSAVKSTGDSTFMPAECTTPSSAHTNNSSSNSSITSGYSSNSDSSESESRGAGINSTISLDSRVAGENLTDPQREIDPQLPIVEKFNMFDAVTEFSYQKSQVNRPSLTGLVNIGNSCFMNSIVQCLSNTTPLRDYFINDLYLADINKGNPLGFKGELAKCFCSVIKQLWSREEEYVSLRSLKYVVSSRNDQFQGYQQQDSHEFMSYLLDGLHEDLNRVREKPVTSPVVPNGLADSVAADKAWHIHKERNDSFIVDNFQGQFKSTLVCPVCRNVSVTFDPFMSLSVPLPRNLRHLPIFFIPQDPLKPSQQYVLKLLPDANLELLKASVARKTGISMLQLRVFEAYNGKFQALMSSNQQPIKSIGNNDVIIVSEVLPKGVEINIIQRLKCPLFPTKCAYCGRHNESDRKLSRCSKCKAVGYCDRQCQSRDWVEHKMRCREGRPTPVGLPFVVSIPPNRFTYSRLASAAEQFARKSVEVTSLTSLRDADNIQEITQTNLGIIDNIPTKNTNSTLKRLLTRNKPQYVFVPVDRYGDKVETEPLKDLGNELLPFRGQYLAMDWLNDCKGEGSIEVRPKDVLDHVPDPTSKCTSDSPTSKNVTLSQCIELFTQPETLSKEEAWYCPKCKEHREATKQISLWKLPEFLIFHLKRFSYSGHHHRDKISFKVDYPLRGLDMTPYILGEAATHANSKALPIYDLYATVNHYGAVYMGHYTAHVKPSCCKGLKKKDWLLYDDEKVRTFSEDEVVDTTSYMLFYRRLSNYTA